MNVWVRVTGRVDCGCEAPRSEANGALTITPGLDLTIYPSEEQARHWQEKLGGVVLEVNAACLKGQNEYDNEVLLVSNEDREAAAPSTASIGVSFDGLPYEMDEEEGIAAFGPEAEAWFNRIQNETDFQMHQ